ncbi:uncharacterized protein [Antedon mediterranea]|uniref:uncharacterized protein n=1 Tax=Antedon mediterranea TaxID=105859 RepID=UPI003AF5FA6C
MEKSYSEAVTPMDWAELVEREFPSLPAPARASERATTPLPPGVVVGTTEDEPRHGPHGEVQDSVPTDIPAVAALLLPPGAESFPQQAEKEMEREDPMSPLRPPSPSMLSPSQPRVALGQVLWIRRISGVSGRGAFDGMVALSPEDAEMFRANIEVAGVPRPPGSDLSSDARCEIQSLARKGVLLQSKVVSTIGPDRIICSIHPFPPRAETVGELMTRFLRDEASKTTFICQDFRLKNPSGDARGRPAARAAERTKPSARSKSSRDARGRPAARAAERTKPSPRSKSSRRKPYVVPAEVVDPSAGEQSDFSRHPATPAAKKGTGYACPVPACGLQGSAMDHLNVHAPEVVAKYVHHQDNHKMRTAWRYLQELIPLLPDGLSTLRKAFDFLRKYFLRPGACGLGNKWLRQLTLTAQAVNWKAPSMERDIRNQVTALVMLHPFCLCPLLAEAMRANPKRLHELNEKYGGLPSCPPPSSRAPGPMEPAPESSSLAAPPRGATASMGSPKLPQQSSTTPQRAAEALDEEARRLLREAYTANQRLAAAALSSSSSALREAAARMHRVCIEQLTLAEELDA